MRQLYTLRIHLPSGAIWTQTGVAYGSIAEVRAVWDKVGPYLPDDTKGQAIDYELARSV